MAGGKRNPFVNLSSDVYAIFRVHAPMPVTVVWVSCVQTLRVRVTDWPPHVSLFLDTPGRGGGIIYALQSAEHGEIIVREGFKVRVPSVLHTFCARLLRDGRANLLAGYHCEVSWYSLDVPGTYRELDAFWSWRKWPHSTPHYDMEGREKP